MDIKPFLDNFRNYKYEFVNEKISEAIKLSVKLLFPNLNSDDSEVLYLFSKKIIEKISLYNYFDNKDEKFIFQWLQNNYRDIKGVILILIPYINDKDNGFLLKSMTDLNQFFYANPTKYIPNNLLNENRKGLLKTDFKFSNMAIGLLSYDSDNLLQLYEDNKKLIYRLIINNYSILLKTLQIMNGKYYINWINIVPILLDNYQSSTIYKKTIQGLIDIQPLLNSPDNFQDFFGNYYGLWFGDIYNVIKHRLYEDVKAIKFLIFPYRNATGQQFYLIQYFRLIFNISLFFNFESFDDLLLEDKIQFEKSIKLEIIKAGNINITFDIWKQIILFLCNDYSLRLVVEENIKEDFSKFSFKPTLKQSDFKDEVKIDEDYSDEIRKKLNNIKNQDVIDFLNKVDIKHIWNFLHQSFRKLENTFFRDFLLIKNDNKVEITDKYYYKETKLSLKNIYNIAKSITHYTSGDEWLSYDNHYVSFDIPTQIEFLKRFLGVDYTWLNLRNNIRKEYGDIDYDTKIDEIKEEWDKIKKNLIFEILVKNGLLNQFDVDLNLTDKRLNSSGKKKLLAEKLKKNKYEEAYYYLTNDKFKNLKNIRFGEKRTLVSYFKLLEEDQLWYTFYAMDWLAQINFFNHYINLRVMYVTGATGQGKSTQVPKLLIYALKAYDFNNTGKVVCTQPRITPTKGNAERISEELGLPINQISEKGQDKDRLDNFHVQVKYSEDNHIRNNCPHLTLKISTDGTLYEEIIKNPMVKEQIYQKGRQKFVYGFKNIYDVVIIDESHEHNTNMDMILTLMRQSCFYNNSLRLIIMSATMDDDEPVYRSYYNCINDAVLYPIKIFSELRNPIFLDRRYHISPPGETTQYIVTEYYDDNIEDIKIPEKNIQEKNIHEKNIHEKNIHEKEISEKIQKTSYKKVLEICQKYPTGEILLFSTGEREIIEAVKELNQFLPPGDVALPYFSKLNTKYKDFIEKIDKNISYIKNKKERIYLEWGSDYIEDSTVMEGTYKRAIIIATNVAEASVTIPRLKFVVDNGYAKVNSYDNNIKTSVLHVEKISEASRIQRKGRVGRQSDGTVYFLYPKGSREKISSKFNITHEDPSDLLLKLLIENVNEEYIIQEEINPNFKNGLFYKLTSNFNKENKLDNLTPIKNNLLNILFKQHSIKNNLINPTLYFSVFPDIIMKNDSLNRGTSGQPIVNLLDLKGDFYIIHPFENDIVRNIRNEIICFKKIETQDIPQYFFNDYLSELQRKMLVIDINYDPSPTYQFANTDILKTNLNVKVRELQKAVSSNDFTINDYLTIFASIGFGCYEEVLVLLVMIKNFENVNEDIIGLYNIYKILKSSHSNLLIFKILNNPKEINKFDDIISIEIKKFKLTKKNEDIKLLDLFKKLFNSGNLENKKGINEIKNYYLLERIKNNLSQNLGINNPLNNFLLKLSEIVLSILTLERNLETDFDEVSPLLWMDDYKSSFRSILKTDNIEEKILKSFIIGRPQNYAIKINNGNYYNLAFPGLYGIIPYKKPNNISSTNLLFYYDYKKGKDINIEFGIYNSVPLEYFVSCLPQIFNKIFFKKEIIIKSMNEDSFKLNYNIININSPFYDYIINYIYNNTIYVSPWEGPCDKEILNIFFRNLRKKLVNQK